MRSPQGVIPGCPEGADPEPMNTGSSDLPQVRVRGFRARPWQAVPE
jgi:hypothetical protein